MPLTEEQIKELKSQLSQQIENLPSDQKAAAQKQIDEMSPGALESMLKQQQAQAQQAGAQKVFRAIIEKQIPSKIIEETSNEMAVLDIKPISKGHVVIIPKKAAAKSSELPDSSLKLAKEISERIISKLKAEGTEIQTEFKFGELVINVIPIYNQPLNITSPRSDAKNEELEELQKTLSAKIVKKTKPEKIKIEKKAGKAKKIKLERRIP